MKKICCFLIVLQVAFCSQAQDLNSASYMNSLLQNAVQKTEGGTTNNNVVHAETGIFTINKGNASDYTTRILHHGMAYTVAVFSDPRIIDFKLLVWKYNGKDWIRYDSINENTHNTINFKEIGDREIIKVEPSDDKEFAFQLISASNSNKTGRYGVVIMADEIKKTNGTSSTGTSGGSTGGSGNSTGGRSTGNGTTGTTGNGTSGSTGNGTSGGSGATTTGTGKFFASCDTVYDANLKVDKDNKWVADGKWLYTKMTTLFEFNPTATVITHTTPEMTSSYFVQTKSNEGNLFSYEVKSDAGNSYTFKLDLDNYLLDIYGKSSSGQWYIRRWHIKRFWKE